MAGKKGTTKRKPSTRPPGQRTPLSPSQVAFAKRLRSFLADHQISQSELARRLKIDPSAVNHWVQGNTVPNGRLLAMIPRAIGANAHWLLGGINVTGARADMRMAGIDGERVMLTKVRGRVLALLAELDQELHAATYANAPAPDEED